MSYHGKLQTLKNGTADKEIQLWAYQQLERELTLTDEEINQIIKQHDWYIKTWVDMVRSIESAILRKS